MSSDLAVEADWWYCGCGQSPPDSLIANADDRCMACGRLKSERVDMARAPTLRIIAYGSPAPQGSKRFLGVSKRGKGILAESSPHVGPWRSAVWAAAHNAKVGQPPLDGPLSVRMVFTMHKPLSAHKRRRTWPDRMPDLSKLARSTEDALTNAGVWADDARVVNYERLAKVFPNEDPDSLASPGVRIEIRALTA